MSADRAGTDDTPTLATWLLASGRGGPGPDEDRPRCSAPSCATRPSAGRQWWNHELFGKPHREAELPVLEETHAALRRLRLLRRQRETLRTTARGREPLSDPDALVRALREDLSRRRLRRRRMAGRRVRAPRSTVRSTTDRLKESVGPLLVGAGWRAADGAPLDGWGSSAHSSRPLCRAEGYGLPLQHVALTGELRAHPGRPPPRRRRARRGRDVSARSGRCRAPLRRGAPQRARRRGPSGGAGAPAADRGPRRDPAGLRVVGRSSLLVLARRQLLRVRRRGVHQPDHAGRGRRAPPMSRSPNSASAAASGSGTCSISATSGACG